MVYFEWTLVRSRTHGQFFAFFLGQVIAVVLTGVAGVAEVGVAPAEPTSCGTAELALELNEVFAVRRTVAAFHANG